MEICSHFLANSPTAVWRPTTRSSPAASFIHHLSKLKSWPAARNLNPSWPAARHGKAPAVQESLTEARDAECHGSCGYIRVKKCPRAEFFLRGQKLTSLFSRSYNVTFANSDSDLPNLLFSESFMFSSFQLRLTGCRHFHFHLLVWRQQKHWTVNFLTKMAIFSAQFFFWTKYSKLFFFFYRFNIATWSLDYLSSLVYTLVIKSVGRSFEVAYLRALWALS